jgi:hypothetical protein
MTERPPTRATPLHFVRSIKDRMALHILTDAYRRGAIARGDLIVEASSGNTGACAEAFVHVCMCAEAVKPHPLPLTILFFAAGISLAAMGRALGSPRPAAPHAAPHAAPRRAAPRRLVLGCSADARL